MSEVKYTNEQLVLICGESSSGKSASLRNIRNQDRWIYLNTEAGKRLPFRNKFMNVRISDPLKVLTTFDRAMEEDKADKIDGIIIDSITFLMDMYESQYVLRAANTMKGWSDYNQFFKEILQNKVIKFGKPTIITAHTLKQLDEQSSTYFTSVPIKGALKGNGVEAYFSTIVAAKKVPVKELLQYENELLHISDLERRLGYKHVFQTRITAKTTGERIRSPMGLFADNEVYIDNDAQLLLDRLKEYYS